MELCGGLGIFLEALLRNGYNIARYTYVDSDPVARSTMAHRLDCLHCRYPRQLPAPPFPVERPCYDLLARVETAREARQKGPQARGEVA